jgi:hypothetical protein
MDEKEKRKNKSQDNYREGRFTPADALRSSLDAFLVSQNPTPAYNLWLSVTNKRG